MERPEQFSDYLFAKMGSTIIGDSDTNKTTDNCDAPIELTGFRKWINKNYLLLMTLFGVIFGVIEGFSLRTFKLSAESILLISYPGELFMRLLKLLILPLIISSLIAGSASLNAKMNGRIALRTLTYFAVTSFFNAALGICLVLLIHPGHASINRGENDLTPHHQTNLLDSLLDLGRNVIPDNLFQASFQQAHTLSTIQNITNTSVFNESYPQPNNGVEVLQVVTREIGYRNGTNTLGIVFFCLVFGTLLGTIGAKGQTVIDFFSAIFEVIMKMVTCVMWLTPLGVSSVIAGKILSVQDIGQVMAQLIWFILTVAIGVFFYQWIILQLIYFLFVRKNPFKFYYGLIHPMLTAFATASTAAALPITFRCMNEKLRIDSRITRFVLPIGCNVNMDGTALFIAIAAIFITQMNGITLGFGELVTVLLCSTAASMSSASVPSAALVLLLVVLQAIDAPIENVSLLFAVDWFVDRIRTTNNMLGDCYAAAVVEQLSKKELMALDALYQDSPTTPNGHIPSSPLSETNSKNSATLEMGCAG